MLAGGLSIKGYRSRRAARAAATYAEVDHPISVRRFLASQACGAGG